LGKGFWSKKHREKRFGKAKIPADIFTSLGQESPLWESTIVERITREFVKSFRDNETTRIKGEVEVFRREVKGLIGKIWAIT